MQTSREDVGIAFRSALLAKGAQQRFSLLVLVILSIILIFLESIEVRPLNIFRSIIKDTVYRSSLIVSSPAKAFKSFTNFTGGHLNLHDNYKKLKEENIKLKNNKSRSDFLELENSQLRKLIDEQVVSSSNLVSARVMIDKQSPYINSFILNIGSNKSVKNGMAVLDGNFFIGRIVDVNFFSSRVLLISDLNSKIPILSEPSGAHAILSGHGIKKPTLEYLPENHTVKDGDKIYTSGKEGIFSTGIPIGKVKIEQKIVKVELFSKLDQITFVNIDIEKKERKK